MTWSALQKAPGVVVAENLLYPKSWPLRVTHLALRLVYIQIHLWDGIYKYNFLYS